MPQALYLAGRKLPCSADDLYLPGVVGTVTRVSMVVGIAVCLGYAASSDTGNAVLNEACPTRMAKPIELGFLAGSLAFMILHAAMYIYMMRVATMDTILNWKRRHQRGVKLIGILACSYAIEVGLAVFGIVVMVSNPCDQKSTVWIVVLSTLVLLWIDLLIALGFAYFLYGHFSPGNEREATWYQKRLQGVGWGFNVLTCGLFGTLNTPDGYGDEAWIMFSEVFHTFVHDMMKDLVVSDVIAGILLLRAEQKRIHDQTVTALANRAFSMSDPGSVPIGLADSRVMSGTSQMDEGSPAGGRSPLSPLQAYLWGNEKKIVKLKAQLLNSSMPVSPRGSWISNLIASEGRVADPGRRMEAFQALEEFEKYSPYQEAMYGWKLFVYSTPLRFLASLKWLNLSWMLPKSSGHSKAHGHKSLKRPNMRSQIEGRVFTHVTGLQDHHVIYASFTAYLGEMVPYTICVDHDRESVVIAVRGTMSYADLVTDLMAMPTELEFAGRQWGFDGKGHYAHSGMLQIANRIRLDIERQGILERLFDKGAKPSPAGDEPVEVEDMLNAETFVTKKQLEETDITSYKLKVVGHSLGAGVAAILTLLLHEKYPKATCLAYEPPGTIFSMELAERSSKWVSSIVCGVDAIPRLSWHNAKRFRAQFFEMLRRSKTSKPKVMATLFRDIPASELLYDPNEVPDEEVRSDLSRMIHKLSLETDSPLDKTPLYLPGRILHLAKTQTVHSGCWKRERKFSPMWVEDRTDFNEIQVNQWMLFDHFPDYNGRIIRKTLKEALAAEGRVSFGGALLMDALNPKLEV